MTLLIDAPEASSHIITRGHTAASHCLDRLQVGVADAWMSNCLLELQFDSGDHEAFAVTVQEADAALAFLHAREVMRAICGQGAQLRVDLGEADQRRLDALMTERLAAYRAACVADSAA